MLPARVEFAIVAVPAFAIAPPLNVVAWFALNDDRSTVRVAPVSFRMAPPSSPVSNPETRTSVSAAVPAL